MNYFYAESLETETVHLYQLEGKIEVGDYVVVGNYDNVPVTAKVTELVSKYDALSNNRYVSDIIQVVDLKAWQSKREKEIENKILLTKMQDKVSEIKMLETLEKYAGKDSEMLELLKAFKGEAIEVKENDDSVQ